MQERPQGPQSSPDVLGGDYLQVCAPRAAAYGNGVDQGFARIERVEHLPAEQAGAVFAERFIDSGPTPAVWCHGVPGPVLLRGGDVQVLDVASPRRVEHDLHHPCWPPAGEMPLLRGAHPAGVTPHRVRREHDRTVDEVEWPEPTGRDRAPRRATSFAKPAGALLVGDYLGVHHGRWPDTDRDIDEGFSRVEHLRLVDAKAASAVFADRSWHTDLVVASVHGVPGVLVLRSSDEVAVLASVNPERAEWERRNYDNGQDPLLLLQGSRVPAEDDVRAAAAADATRRPDVDESELYPSRLSNPFSRRMALESEHGFRSVPLTALPWPHLQSDCPLGDLAEQHRDRVPDTHGAHAAAFLSRSGRQIQASCDYHQADWPRLVRILEEALAAATKDERPLVNTHPEFTQLAPTEQKWLEALVYDPIRYSDGSHALINGQHRLCAMRAAGVTHCPVEGTYLPDTDYGPAAPPEDDARAEIVTSWRRLATDNDLPTWIATAARFAPPFVRSLLIELTTGQPHRRRRSRLHGAFICTRRLARNPDDEGRPG